jgi:hypothetical protein
MKKYFILFLLFFSLLLSSNSIAQWEAGVLVNLKNEVPKRGLGFIVSRNLPFQFPVLGLKVRLEADFFRHSTWEKKMTEKNIYLSLAGTMHYRQVQPYLSLGTGYAFLSDNRSLLFQGIAGIQFTFIKPIYPFLEFKSVYYVSAMYDVQEELKNFQVIGALGIKLVF